jgi:glucokinase
MARQALGVDLGGTNARAAVVDVETGAVEAMARETLADRTPAAVVEAVARVVAAAAGPGGARGFGAVGVGVAGQVLGSSGLVLNAPNLGWRDVAFGGLLEGRVGVPVRIVNDLSAAAWGEARFGAARDVRDALVVFVGTGVGSGLVLGGRLHEGARGVAGELGHVKVRPPRPSEAPRRCGCGAVGCLEAYAGGANVSARVRAELAAGARSSIRDRAGGDLSRVNAGSVEEAAAAGDAYARRLWDEVGELLGLAIAGAVTLLNPRRLVLGGGVLLGCPTLYEIVEWRVRNEASRSAAASLEVERAARGDEAGVVGAALLGVEERLA